MEKPRVPYLLAVGSLLDARFSDLSARRPRNHGEMHGGTKMTDDKPRTRPDGSAWRRAQQDVAARNDAARERGRKERAQSEQRDALNREAATRRGIAR